MTTCMPAPKLTCVFLCTLVCDPKLVYALVCSPNRIWIYIYIYIYIYISATPFYPTPRTPSSLTLAPQSSWLWPSALWPSQSYLTTALLAAAMAATIACGNHEFFFIETTLYFYSDRFKLSYTTTL